MGSPGGAHSGAPQALVTGACDHCCQEVVRVGLLRGSETYPRVGWDSAKGTWLCHLTLLLRLVAVSHTVAIVLQRQMPGIYDQPRAITLHSCTQPEVKNTLAFLRSDTGGIQSYGHGTTKG